ncbi:MAG: NUDIX hydrolase [Spirochaetes bacterium]|nr:MAG: NUDIX hydrolase [Spirochaetota bacterium]
MKRDNTKVVPTFNNVHNKKYNTEDGVKWDSRACAVVAHVWFIHNGVPHMLIGKRGPTCDHPNLWNIPCGYIDWNENLRGAIYREVWEETGLNLNNFNGFTTLSILDQPWHVNTQPSENRQNIVLHGAIIVENVFDTLPELSLENMEEDESTGAYWMSLDAILAMNPNEFAFNHKERVLDFVLKYGDKLKK